MSAFTPEQLDEIQHMLSDMLLAYHNKYHKKSRLVKSGQKACLSCLQYAENESSVMHTDACAGNPFKTGQPAVYGNCLHLV